MSAQPRNLENESEDRQWRKWAGVLVVLSAAGAAALGFIVLPVVQGRAAGIDAWTAICRSLGILPGTPAVSQPLSTALAAPVSNVAWTPAILRRLAETDPARGVAASQLCIGCHGEAGISLNPQFPDLAGQSAFAIYKQLHDYKSGVRTNELMAGTVAQLDAEQMADVAAHMARLSTGASDSRLGRAGDEQIMTLVTRGDPARGLPACGSCHSVNSGGPIETPVISGQREEYIAAQLRAFARGERSNDVYHRMRSVASKLTDAEIQLLSRYYARAR